MFNVELGGKIYLLTVYIRILSLSRIISTVGVKGDAISGHFDIFVMQCLEHVFLGKAQ